MSRTSAVSITRSCADAGEAATSENTTMHETKTSLKRNGTGR
jgi:hypothetical protein